MTRNEIIALMGRIDELADEIDAKIPGSEISNSEFRADLAGLLAVMICATYETCVKEIINEHAARFHELFHQYTTSQYERINSKIAINDLTKYARTFHPEIGTKFKSTLKERKDVLLLRTGFDIQLAYSQLLDWRHEFAHRGARVTTVEEIMKTHRSAKRVIFCFGEAFGGLVYDPPRRRRRARQATF